MKRAFIYCLTAMGIMAAAACQKDNPQVPVGESTGTDDAEYLLTNLVFRDENNQIDGYMTGFGLNEADPGEISIPCETLEKAQEMFRKWIPEVSVSYQNGESIIWEMTDTLGRSQGKAVLAPGGDKGAVAHVELPSGFPLVSSVRFLPPSAFPHNGEKQMFEGLDEYYFLNVVAYGGTGAKTYYGSGEFVVLREYDEDTNTSGIIAFFDKTEYNMWDVLGFWSDVSFDAQEKMFRKVSEMRIVGWDAYKPFAKVIDKVMKSIGGGVGSDPYACKPDSGSGQRKMRFTDWEPSNLGAYSPTYHTCYIYFFTVEEKKGGGYKLVYK